MLVDHTGEEIAIAAIRATEMLHGVHRKGISIGGHDLLIGATALAMGAKVATRDLRNFPRIPGLSISEW